MIAALSACLVHVAGVGTGRAAGEMAAGMDEATFLAFLDVLLPADDLSPSASASGVGPELLDIARTVAPFERLILLGVRWLNETGSVPFHALPEADKMIVVRWMSTSDYNHIPRRFFHLVRLSAIEIYYSKPEALAGLALNDTPQPEGYPPPWA